jgi:DNA-3-methyladenine glycosylase II
MWYDGQRRSNRWNPAIAHLRRADPRLRALIDRVGPCLLCPRRDHFVILCKAIFNQQISMAVAAVLFARFRDLFPRRRPTPMRLREILQIDPPALQRCGLSRQKRAYLLDLAEHFADRRVPTRRFARMSDQQIIDSLVAIRGVGRWTAEMFLIFVLNRPDVLPVDDLGLRKAMQKLFDLPEMPDARTCTTLARPWRPYATVATWYLWRGLE